MGFGCDELVLYGIRLLAKQLLGTVLDMEVDQAAADWSGEVCLDGSQEELRLGQSVGGGRVRLVLVGELRRLLPGAGAVVADQGAVSEGLPVVGHQDRVGQAAVIRLERAAKLDQMRMSGFL